MEIKVKHKIGDYVNFIGQENKLRVVGYDYMQDRGLRYILSIEQEYKYVYPSEIETWKELNSVGFVVTEE